MNVYPLLFSNRQIINAAEKSELSAYKTFITDTIQLLEGKATPLSFRSTFQPTSINSSITSSVEKRLSSEKIELEDAYIVMIFSGDLGDDQTEKFGLATFFHQYLNEHKTERFKILIISEEILFPTSEQAYDVIRQYVERKQILHFNFQSKPIIDYPGIDLSRLQSIFDHLIYANSDPLDLLKLKMIKGIGHFKINKKSSDDGELEHTFCHRYFYDGSKCVEEIRTLLKEIIAQHKAKRGILELPILYHGPNSPWLDKALASIGEINIKIETSIENLFTDTRDGVPMKEWLAQQKHILIILDVVDSGDTFLNDVIIPLKRENKSTEYYTCSILRAKEEMKFAEDIKINNHTLKRDFVQGNMEHPVISLMQVEQITTKADKHNCPLCAREVEHTPFYSNGDPIIGLSSDVFWHLCDEAGFKPEENIPCNNVDGKCTYVTNTRSKGFVRLPHFRGLISANGAYLANIVENNLRHHHVIKNADKKGYTFVCPKQPGAEALAKNIRALIKNSSVILIPEDLYKSVDDPKAFKRKMEGIDEYLKAELISLKESGSPAIVIDEYTSSGNTLRQLEKLLKQAFDIGVSCFFPLVILKDDDSPIIVTDRSTQRKMIGEKRVYSLYSIANKFTLFQIIPN
jgi:hypothetical protein